MIKAARGLLVRLAALEAIAVGLTPHARALIYQLKGPAATTPERREAARLRGTRDVLILRSRVDASKPDEVDRLAAASCRHRKTLVLIHNREVTPI